MGEELLNNVSMNVAANQQAEAPKEVVDVAKQTEAKELENAQKEIENYLANDTKTKFGEKELSDKDKGFILSQFENIEKNPNVLLLNNPDVSEFEKIKEENVDPYPNLAPFEEQMIADVAQGDAEIEQQKADLDKTLEETKQALIASGMTEAEAEAQISEMKEKAYQSIQEKYENEHPDYKKSKDAVNEKFGDIQEKHDTHMQEWEENWKSQEGNEEPGLKDFAKDPDHPTQEELDKYNEAHTEWQEKRDEAKQEEEDKYLEENEDYRCYQDNKSQDEPEIKKPYEEIMTKLGKSTLYEAISSGRYNNYVKDLNAIKTKYLNNEIKDEKELTNSLNDALSNYIEK